MNSVTAFITAVVQPVIDFLGTVVNKFGTKFALAVASIAAIFYSMQEKLLPNCPEWIPYACITVITVAYFIARHKQETAGTSTTEPPASA